MFKSLVSVSVFGGLALLASAAPKVGAAQKAAGPYATQVAQLRATAHLLQLADHDYKGHRAKAVHEIHLAIHILHPGHKKHHPSTAKKSGGNNEPQAVSDGQLKQAITQLTTIKSELTSAPSQAPAAVNAAISELKTALTIK